MATTQTSNGDITSFLAKLEDNLDLYLRQKAPFTLPKNAKEAIVTFMPWIVLILMIFALPIILGLLGLSFLLSPFMGITRGIGNIFSTIVLAAAVVFEILAIPGLMHKSRKGWVYAYYSALLSIVSSLLNFNIVSAIIGGLISLYVLFQVREYYK